MLLYFMNIFVNVLFLFFSKFKQLCLKLFSYNRLKYKYFLLVLQSK